MSPSWLAVWYISETTEGHARRDEPCDHDGYGHADDAGDEGEGEAFEEKLGEDVAAAGSEGFEEAYFAGALGDGD